MLHNLVQLHREASSSIQELLACEEKEQKGGGVGESYSDSWVGNGCSVGRESQPKVPDETSSLPSPATILPQPPQTVPISASSSQAFSLGDEPLKKEGGWSLGTVGLETADGELVGSAGALGNEGGCCSVAVESGTVVALGKPVAPDAGVSEQLDESVLFSELLLDSKQKGSE